MTCFCDLHARTFETQEVESLTALKTTQELMRTYESYESYRKPQESARSYCKSNYEDLFECLAGGRNAQRLLEIYRTRSLISRTHVQT